MSITATPYPLSYRGCGLARFDFTAHTFKAALTTDGYIPVLDTDEFFDDVTNEVTGVGYTAGGVELTGLAWTYDTTNNRMQLDCDEVAWTGATLTARRAIIYRDTGDPATSPLLSWVDFGADAAPAGTTFTITFTDGVYRISTDPDA
jgi:hypothetical protein